MVRGIKLHMIALFLCIVVPFSIVAKQEDTTESDVAYQADEAAQKNSCHDDHGCNARIELVNLCAKKIKALCGDFTKLNADELCAALANILNLKAQNACINNLCVDNLKANSFEYCTPYKATTVYSANTNYTLGTPLAFDVILDDPNGDVSLVPFTTYTAPVSGYYIVSFQADFDSFVLTTNPILGTPISNPQIYVNGILAHESFAPFLAFHNEQHSLITTLISLKAGDVVSTNYIIYTTSDAGFITVPGTGLIEGNGTELDKAMFKIHFLSSDCTPPICQPCEVPTQCTPCPTTSCCY